MRVPGGVLAVVGVAGVLLLVGAGPAAASASPVTDGERVDVFAAEATASGDINLTQEFRPLPDAPGEVVVHLQFAIPDRVRSLRTRVPAEGRVVETAGFDAGDDRYYRWDESTEGPTITYVLAVNESVSQTGPEAADGDLVFVDTGEWSLFRRPPTPTEWNFTGSSVGFSRHTTVVGPGAAGESLVFLGLHEETVRTTDGQRIRLVVPADARLVAPPGMILDSMGSAAASLEVGARDEEVFVVAAPSANVDWGLRGAQVGEADMWVRDVEPVASPHNVWVHEYVHSRQTFSLATDMRWFAEASATYYAALLTFESGHVGYRSFRNRLLAGSHPRYADAVLADPGTWRANPQYEKGALVAGNLDRLLRLASDGDRALQSVFGDLNADPGRTSLADFLSLLGTQGDQAVARTAERLVGTPANASMWNRSQHTAAFGSKPARLAYRVPSREAERGFRLTGPYRSGRVPTDGDTLLLSPGERLHADVLVTNEGGSPGAYNVSMGVNGTAVDRATGSVRASGTVNATLAHQFDETGRYRVRVRDRNLTVDVVRPATAKILQISVEPAVVRPGESAVVAMVLNNDADRPARTNVTVRRDDIAVSTRQVRLGPNSEERIAVPVQLDDPGTRRVAVNDLFEATVQVRPATPTATPTTQATTAPPQTVTTADTTPTTTATGPGFGPAVLVTAVTLWLGFRRARA